MSLNYNFGNIKDYQTLVFDESGRMNVKTEVLIFATMIVDLGKITEKNVDEFWRRLDLYQRSVGHLMANDKGPMYFTRDDVVAHIGLSTNVGNTTPATWNRRFAKMLFDQAVEAQRARNRK